MEKRTLITSIQFSELIIALLWGEELHYSRVSIITAAMMSFLLLPWLFCAQVWQGAAFHVQLINHQGGISRSSSWPLLSSLSSTSTSSSSPPLPTPLSMPVNELGLKINGTGRALTTWDCYKVGLDPIYFFNSENHKSWDHTVNGLISGESIHDGDEKNKRELIVDRYMPMKRRQIHSQEKGMGAKALNALSDLYPNSLGIEYSIASLVKIQRSSDGTVKLLLKLNNRATINTRSIDDDGNNSVSQGQEYFIETVIIPWNDRSNPTSTLCVSTQVGCAQGCTFCATGKMGLLKRLTSDEILIQLYYAKKICRLSRDSQDVLPDIDNIVFMGMGDSGDNAEAVIEACSIMADRQCFSIPQNKITISTVGPNPDVFHTLGKADAVLAWSVHAVEDTLRKKLVPTTKYKMVDLKEGLIEALMRRSRRMRALMLEVTLIEDVNDGIKEAEEMVDFCLEMKERVDGMKLVVNLIPFNYIGHGSYRRSPDNNVAEFQRILVENNVKTYVRTTRGDDENAACGQLATKRLRGKQS